MSRLLSNLVTYRWFHRLSASHYFWLDHVTLFNYIFLTPPDKFCCDHRQHFDFFQDVNRIHDEKYHPGPSIICVVIDNILAFLSNTRLGHVLRYTLSFAEPWKLILVYPLWSSNPIFTWNAMSLLPRSMTVVSEYQQEHWKRNAKCFLIKVIQTPLYG